MARAAPLYLAVVGRERAPVFEYLQTHFALERDVVEVIWDRRRGERRRLAVQVAHDRRRADRRSQPPATWHTLGMLVVPRRPGTVSMSHL